MQLQELINQKRSYVVDLSSQKQVFETLANIFKQSMNDIESEEIFEALLTRERLGSTALGHGVAIPHIRLSKLREPIGAIIKLQQAIGFDAPDDNPVDLIFALAVPEEATEEHLQILAKLAKYLSQEEFRENLRDASDNEMLFEAATNYHATITH